MSHAPTSTLTLLSLPVPPMLEEALGYHGPSRWVAFYCTPSGDELVYDDGTVSADGSWFAWLTFLHHPRVASTLHSYHLGSSETDATHWLLLDRETRTLSVGLPAEVKHFLRQAAPPVLTSERLTALREASNQRLHNPQNLQVLVAQAMRRNHQLIHALKHWLDAQ